MYNWRKMTEVQRMEALALRRGRKLPWHSPPHLDFAGVHQYLISAACHEHAPIVGVNPERMTQCEADVLQICAERCLAIHAWCVLPNHYHVLVKTERIKELRHGLGLFHGRSSFTSNGEDGKRGRQVWYNCFERPIKSERHFWATLNYIHRNPVHHGYVKIWQDWPWSSATKFLESFGRKEAREIWKRYPILDYGKKWDISPLKAL
jgi:putative transposase